MRGVRVASFHLSPSLCVLLASRNRRTPSSLRCGGRAARLAATAFPLLSLLRYRYHQRRAGLRVVRPESFPGPCNHARAWVPLVAESFCSVQFPAGRRRRLRTAAHHGGRSTSVGGGLEALLSASACPSRCSGISPDEQGCSCPSMIHLNSSSPSRISASGGCLCPSVSCLSSSRNPELSHCKSPLLASLK